MSAPLLPSWVSALLCVVLVAGCQHEKKLSSDSPEAIRLYTDGVKQWELFYYAEAKQSFEKALAVDSGFAMVYGRLGLLELSMADQIEARRLIAHALKLSERATQREQLFIRMWNYRIENQFTNAAAVADSLIALYPEEPEAYLTRGLMYEVTKKPDAAVEMYRRSIEVDTGFAQGVMSLGYAYSVLGDQEKAVTYMQRYIGMAPGAADPHASYADILVRAGRYDEALEQYRISLEKKPDYWYAFQQIGRIDVMLGRLNDGRKQIERAVSLLPPGGRMRFAMSRVDADLSIQRGAYAEALKICTNVLQQDSTDLEASARLVQALARMKRFPEAHRALDRLYRVLEERRLTETETMVGYSLLRSEIFRLEGRREEALETCSQALDVASPLGRGSVYRELARVHLHARDWENALDAVEQSLAVNPNHPGTLWILTRIYAGQGEKRMTREIGERLLALWKDADPDFQDRNDLLHLLGRKRPG